MAKDMNEQLKLDYQNSKNAGLSFHDFMLFKIAYMLDRIDDSFDHNSIQANISYVDDKLLNIDNDLEKIADALQKKE